MKGDFVISNWIESTLGTLIDSGDAHLQTGPFGTVLKAAEYSDTGAPLISVREIRYGYLKISNSTPRVNQETISRLPQFVLKKGDIVFGRKGGTDRNAIIKENEDGWFLGSDGIRLRLTDSVDHLFFSYQMRSPLIQNWLSSNSEGTTMPSLNQKVLARIPITLPPIEKQKAIAHILGSLDDKIELNRQINETLESMAQALFKSWFVDFDPVIDNALAAGNTIPEVFAERAKQRATAKKTDHQSDSTSEINDVSNYQHLFPAEFEFTEEMGWVPLGWKVKNLTEIAEFQNGFAFYTSGYSESGYKVVDLANISAAGRFIARIQFTSATLPFEACRSALNTTSGCLKPRHFLGLAFSFLSI